MRNSAGFAHEVGHHSLGGRWKTQVTSERLVDTSLELTADESESVSSGIKSSPSVQCQNGWKDTRGCTVEYEEARKTRGAGSASWAFTETDAHPRQAPRSSVVAVVMIQIQIQIRRWKQVATQTSTAPQGELTVRKTRNSRPRSQRPRRQGRTVSLSPAYQRPHHHSKELHFVSSLRRGHANLLCIVPREIHELCVSSLRKGRAMFTVLKGQENFRKRAAPLVLLHRSKKPPISTFPNYACHPCTGVMPSASNSRCVITQAKKGSSKAEYPPEVADVRAIPVQIDSNRSHGEQSGNPYQPGSPGANDSSPVSDPFQSRHPCKVLSMFLLDACHGDLIRCVLEGFIPFLRG